MEDLKAPESSNIVDRLLDIIEERDRRISELTDAFLRLQGIIPSETKIVVPEPIESHPVTSNWNRKKRYLESLHRKPKVSMVSHEMAQAAQEASIELQQEIPNAS